MSVIQSKYKAVCEEPSDINEHLPILYKYGLECQHVTEMGVRSVVSSYAFANALRGREGTKLVQVDLQSNENIQRFGTECAAESLQRVFYQDSSLTCRIEQTDLLFIDTWHVYGHLKRELERWNKHVGKYIIMHDTTVDEWLGETVRVGWNSAEQSRLTGIPENEIRMGLWPAIGEFLEKHPEWKTVERFTNNNGLTVLKRCA
jgi:hypothetical protein